MKKKKLNYSKLIFEFISVSFAVLFALFVNQWREDHNNGVIADKAIVNIKAEIIENRDVINDAISNHKFVLSQIDSLFKSSEISKSDINSIKNLEVNLLSSSSWEMAQVTKAIFYIDFNKSNVLAKVYSFQSYYESIVKQYVLGNFYDRGQDLESLKITQQFIKSIIPMEENLKEFYDLMLKEVLTDNVSQKTIEISE